MSERRPRRLLYRHPAGPGWWALLALLVSLLAPLVHAEQSAWRATSASLTRSAPVTLQSQHPDHCLLCLAWSLTRSAPVTLQSQHPDHCLLCLAWQQWRAADLPAEARPVVRGAETVLLAPRSDPCRPCVVRVRGGGSRAPPLLLPS